MPSLSRLPLLLVSFAFAHACQCGVPEVDDGGTDAIPCIINSDCGEDAHCDDGFCVDGLAPGTCRTEEDCDGDEVCIFPEGSDVGACINPHACDVDADCLDGQVCEDGNGDGFRDCLYAGCSSDDECVIELASQCGINDTARCVARACVCRDLCGAPCGEDRQCCALAGTTATCINDPGPCGTFACDPGFQGVPSSYGEWESPTCGYADEVCACEELPPLPAGAIGNAQVMRAAPNGALYVIAYDTTYGDVVIAPATSSTLSGFRHIDGVPSASVDTPIVAGPSGPRGGIEAPGPDVGSALDAAFAPDGTLYVVAYDATAGALRLLVGTPDGPMTASVIDSADDVGRAARVHVTSDGTLVVSAIARRTSTTQSELRVYGASLPVANGAAFSSRVVDSVALTTVDCEGGCDDAEVCVAAVAPATVALCQPEGVGCDCPANNVCTLQGCAAKGTAAPLERALLVDGLALTATAQGVIVIGHEPRAGALVGYRQNGGSITEGTATFAKVTILDNGDDDVGGRPSAVADGANVLVAATDASNRALTLFTLGSTLNTLSTVTLDDGERPDPSGAINSHAVDASTLARGANGDVVIAWHDGTLGAVHARFWPAGGTLGPRQLLAGGLASTTYDGTYGLVLSSALGANGPAVSARHLWLANDPPVRGLVVLDDLLACPDDDVHEDNDTAETATEIAAPSSTKGIICGDTDDDFFRVAVGPGCTVTAELVFEHDDGDLDLRMLDAGGASLDTSLSTGDSEIVTSTLVNAGNVTLRVDGFQSAENAYVLRVDVDCP
jgi:hypothetical protein